MSEKEIIGRIREELFALRDEKYAVFQTKLIPGMGVESVIGVRTPELRSLAKKLVKDEDIGFCPMWTTGLHAISCHPRYSKGSGKL